MSAEIREVGQESIPQIAAVPIRFTVESVLRVVEIDGGLGGLALREEPLRRPYVKDYDQYDDESPATWAERFDVSKWGFFLAREGETPVGAAAVAFDTAGVDILAGQKDLVALWDIRLRPEHRRRGVGTDLFARAIEWARAKNCRHLKIETQNINVPACRFYARQGCRLGAIDRHGYGGDPRVAGETMLLWYLDL